MVYLYIYIERERGTTLHADILQCCRFKCTALQLAVDLHILYYTGVAIILGGVQIIVSEYQGYVPNNAYIFTTMLECPTEANEMTLFGDIFFPVTRCPC